jgi:hypothetical protein
MTGVMIIFAFGMSLVIGYVERTIIHHEDSPSLRKSEVKEMEPLQQEK